MVENLWPTLSFMLKGMKVAKHVKSDGMFCIICVICTAFTLRYSKVFKIIQGFIEPQYQDLRFCGM